MRGAEHSIKNEGKICHRLLGTRFFEARTAVVIELVFIGVVLVLIVRDLFLEEAIVLKVHCQQPITEDDVGKGGPVIPASYEGIDHHPVLIEAYLQGAFGLIFQKSQCDKEYAEPGQKGAGYPAKGCHHQEVTVPDTGTACPSGKKVDGQAYQ